VSSVPDIKIIGECFFEESLCFSGATAERGGLPAVESAWSFNLVDLRALIFVKSANNHSDAERSHSSSLGELLDHICNTFSKHEGGYAVLIASVVNLDVFTGFEQHRLEVRADSWVGHAHVVAEIFYLVDRCLVSERWWKLLLCCDYNSVLGSDSHSSLAIFHSCQGVAYFGQAHLILQTWLNWSQTYFDLIIKGAT